MNPSHNLPFHPSGQGCFVLCGDVMAVATSFRSHCPLQEERLRRGDDLRLQMALEESRRDTVKFPKKKEVSAFLEGKCCEAAPQVCQGPQPNPQCPCDVCGSTYMALLSSFNN